MTGWENHGKLKVGCLRHLGTESIVTIDDLGINHGIITLNNVIRWNDGISDKGKINMYSEDIQCAKVQQCTK